MYLVYRHKRNEYETCGILVLVLVLFGTSAVNHSTDELVQNRGKALYALYFVSSVRKISPLPLGKETNSWTFSDAMTALAADRFGPIQSLPRYFNYRLWWDVATTRNATAVDETTPFMKAPYGSATRQYHKQPTGSYNGRDEYVVL